MGDEKDMVVNMWKVILNKGIKRDHLTLFRNYQNYLGEGFVNGYFEREILNQRLEEAVEKLKDQFFEQIATQFSTEGNVPDSAYDTIQQEDKWICDTLDKMPKKWDTIRICREQIDYFNKRVNATLLLQDIHRDESQS